MTERIKKCLIGAKYTEEAQEFKELGIDVITLPLSPLLDEEINNHADMLSFNCNNEFLIADKHIKGELDRLLPGVKTVECNDIASPYPNDVRLNATLLGNRLICNKQYTSKELLQWAQNNSIEVISTKQGYCKCNLCVLNNSAVITEDDSLAYLLKIYQINVLKISKGYVSLSDKHYGFIGGASAKISETEIYFSGDLSTHPDYDEMCEFMNQYNISPIFNKNRKLNDFGGIVSIN